MKTYDDPEDVVEQTAFVLGENTYLPHYRRDVFVGPGYGLENTREYLGKELMEAGAKTVRMFLWPRLSFVSNVTTERAEHDINA